MPRMKVLALLGRIATAIPRPTLTEAPGFLVITSSTPDLPALHPTNSLSFLSYPSVPSGTRFVFFSRQLEIAHLVSMASISRALRPLSRTVTSLRPVATRPLTSRLAQRCVRTTKICHWRSTTEPEFASIG
jgi:hypothetical protein